MKIIVSIFVLIASAFGQYTTAGNPILAGNAVASTANPLVSIVISGPATLLVGNTGQYTATGHYATGSTQPLTLTSTGTVWTISDPTIAGYGTQTSTQPVTCLKGGSVILTAANSTVSGTFVLTCGVTLTGIVISPLSPTQAVPSSTNFTATCSYSDSSTADCTAQIGAWTSGNTTVATVTGSGVTPQPVKCLVAGTSTIQFSFGGFSPSTTLTCTGKTLSSIAVTPANPSQAVGSSSNFVATGTYSDASTADVSASAVWTSSSNTVASPTGSGTSPQPYLCNSAGGPVTVTATIGAVSGTTGLTCTAGLAVVTASCPPAIKNTAYSCVVSATGGTTPYSWTSTGALPTGISFASSSTVGTYSGTPSVTGTFPVVPKVTDNVAATATQSLTIAVGTTGVDAYCGPGNTPLFGPKDGPATLPQTCYYTDPSATPSPGTILGPYSDLISLQAAVNSVSCGQTVEFQAGIILAGTLTLPSRICDQAHYITLQPHQIALNYPAYGNRASFCQWGIASRTGYPSQNCGSTINVGATIMSTGNDAGNAGIVLNVTGPSSYWLIRGIRFTRTSGAGDISRLVNLPTTGIDHFIFDRDWFDGSTTVTDNTTRAMDISGGSYMAIIDSDLTEFHCNGVGGGCSDGQGIADGINNTGVAVSTRKVVNDFCTASGEGCYLSGGGTANTVPTDLEYRLNYVLNPLSWNPDCTVPLCGVAFLGGTPYEVKNLLEFKNGNRALIEGNFFQNVWAGFSQTGNFVLLTPKSQSNLCPLCQDQNVTIRYNYGDMGNYAVQIANLPSDAGGWMAGGNTYSLHDNVWDDLGDPVKCHACGSNVGNGLDGGTYVQPDATTPSNMAIHDLTRNHEDFIPATGAAAKSGLLGISGPKFPNPAQMYNYTWENNLALFQTGGGATGIANPLDSCGAGFNANCSPNNTPATAQLNAVFDGYIENGNALVNGSGGAWPGTNCTSETTLSSILTTYNNGVMIPGGDFHVKSSSACHNTANDGTDPGANIDALTAAISGVNTWVSFNPAPPTWAQVNTPAAATQIRAFTIDGSGNFWIVDRISGVYTSTDGGATWTAKNGGLPRTTAWSITWDATHSQLILGLKTSSATTAMFYKSGVPVTTWTNIPIASTLSAVSQYSDFAFTPGGNIAMGGFYSTGGHCGYYYSTNGGTTTTEATASGPYTNTPCTGGGGAWSFYTDPNSGNVFVGTEQYGVLRSTDGGATFQQYSPADSAIDGTYNFTNSDLDGIAADASGNILMGGQGGIWKASGTFNGNMNSLTWTKTYTNSNTSAIRTIWADPNTAGRFLMGHGKDANNPTTVYESTDNGLTWHSFSVGMPTGLEAWHFMYNSFDGHIYATIQNGSTNAGYIYKY